MRYLLCHGFGFSNGYWDNLLPYLDGEYEFWRDNFIVREGQAYVGIGHSLGFLKLNNSGIKFKALIGIQSFLNFCGNDPVRRKRLQKNLDRMIMQCKRDRDRLLEFFYSLCGYTGAGYTGLNRELLIADLLLMKNRYEHCGCPTLIIGSAGDAVVENWILQDDFAGHSNIKLRYIDHDHHTLGFDRPNEVFELIKGFLREVDECKSN